MGSPLKLPPTSSKVTKRPCLHICEAQMELLFLLLQSILAVPYLEVGVLIRESTAVLSM
jgi:hypothetical protein